MTKCFKMLVADLSLMDITFWNPGSIPTMWTKGLLSNHIRYIAISVLKAMLTFGIVSLYLNGDTAYSEQVSNFVDILHSFSISYMSSFSGYLFFLFFCF